MKKAQLTRIGIDAFSGCSHLKEIVFPDNLGWIESNAFCQCWGLEKITLPKSIKRIDRDAFIRCSRLKDVYYKGAFNEWCKIFIGSSPIELGGRLHCADQDEVRDVTISGTDVVRPHILSGVDTLRSVTLGPTVTEIKEGAFCRSSVEEVKLTNVDEIGKYTFSDCEKLRSIDFGHGDVVIGNSAFYGCNSLVHLELPNSIQEIGAKAFACCSDLETVVIGINVMYVLPLAFWYCMLLERVEFQSYSNLRKLSGRVFKDCPSLKELVLPEGLTELTDMFYLEGLETITIPSTLVTVESRLFSDNKKLKQIIYRGTEQQFEENLENVDWDRSIIQFAT